MDSNEFDKKADTIINNLNEIKTILQNSCDRDWKDESLYTTAVIVANTMYWKNKEIESLEKQLSKALGLDMVIVK